MLKNTSERVIKDFHSMCMSKLEKRKQCEQQKEINPNEAGVRSRYRGNFKRLYNPAKEKGVHTNFWDRFQQQQKGLYSRFLQPYKLYSIPA